ncbi:uncharacterized protein LOC120072152 [Benincasa hispida]|uniref:uncharacterized protein LOC120072152 n=1 Tax=Benincasa hispida TaxID=102211 RepID=UPI0018FFBED0|nr:uncharacterized protein LOC120072152 [Benincasa hispida]
MDNQGSKFQFFDIFYQIFHFIMKVISSKAQETVILGNLVSHESNTSSQELTTTLSLDHSASSLTNDDLKKSKESQELITTLNSNHSSSSLTNNHPNEPKELDLSKEIDKNNDGSLPSTTKRAPKKMVSINETVEDIDSIMRERRKKKGTKKSKSFDFDNGYDASLKPTRSILKVGSIKDSSDLSKATQDTPFHSSMNNYLKVYNTIFYMKNVRSEILL